MTPWSTRDGEPPAPKRPDAAPDLGEALGGLAPAGRERASVAQARARQERERRQRAARAAGRGSALARLRRAASSRTARLAAVAVAAAAVAAGAWIVLAGRLDPPLSVREAVARIEPVRVAASAQFGAPARLQSASAGPPGAMTAVFTAPAGERRYDGGRLARACTIRYAVDLRTSGGKLKFKALAPARCR